MFRYSQKDTIFSVKKIKKDIFFLKEKMILHFGDMSLFVCMCLKTMIGLVTMQNMLASVFVEKGKIRNIGCSSFIMFFVNWLS